MEVARVFGGQLFEAVFKDDVRTCLLRSLDEADRRGTGLRLRLRLTEVPELNDLPWEYLHYPTLNQFLALSTKVSVVRYLDLPQRIRPLAVEPPLKVLVMISSPSDYPQLDVNQEWMRLNQALGNLEQQGRVTLERLEEATLPALQRRLRRGEYHLFHFIGHGDFDEQAQDGLLLLEDEGERGRLVSGQYLATLMHDERTLRLAILNACEGARTTRTDPFAGTAQSLVQQGDVPAVIAMQFGVTDAAAITFAQAFYAAVADGYAVDAALAEARKAIFVQGHGVEWGAPALYMRAPDGVLFSIQGEDEQQEEQRTVSEEQESRPGIVQTGGGVVIGGQAEVHVEGSVVGHDQYVGVEAGEREEFRTLFENLRALVVQRAELDDAEREDLLAQVNALEEELARPEPDLGKVNSLKETLLSKGAWLAGAVTAILQYPPVQEALKAAFQRVIGG